MHESHSRVECHGAKQLWVAELDAHHLHACSQPEGGSSGRMLPPDQSPAVLCASVFHVYIYSTIIITSQ